MIVILKQSCARLSAILAHGITAHLDAMCVVDQPVEDSIGERGIANRSCRRETGSCAVRIERTWYLRIEITGMVDPS